MEDSVWGNIVIVTLTILLYHMYNLTHPQKKPSRKLYVKRGK